ncbi:IS982 family transposase [Nonomuraea basaltis]|uniref:IS982 family transposase n=1 Tax=Nonomuraea basaltis TaxID=2495887 RepID=UPI00110C69CE|nr:IS982 family transposase [Nonomuraea basaltis]TMR89099.1 IS982 family transposase [Nonomuraea basaltis]
MTDDLNTLATALYFFTDETLKTYLRLAPDRPPGGFDLTLSDAEVVTLAVMSALLSEPSERRWVRRVRVEFRGLFPGMPGQSGYNKRLRKAAPLLMTMIRFMAAQTALWWDDLWVVDSTPVPCGASRETVLRSDLAGWAEYGYCASHSRFFWGLRLHLVCTLSGLPIMFALSGAKADERDVPAGMLEVDAAVVAARPGQKIMGDKNYFGREFEADLTGRDLVLLRPARKGEAPRAGRRFLKPWRQCIESINQTLKGQLDLERHAGRTVAGVTARVAARLLALTAVIWHNEQTGQPIKRSLVAYDH